MSEGELDLSLAAAPMAECLVCGHEQELGVWREGTSIGVCIVCRDLAAVNRGPCEPARDCGCWHRLMQMHPDDADPTP